jgi:anti-anti-sigma factor
MKHPVRSAGAVEPPERDQPAAGVSVDRLPSGALLVQVHGALDARSGLELEGRLRASIGERGGPPTVLLNLSGVGYLDRAGLNCLLRLQRDIAAADGGIELLAPSPAVIRLVHEADLHGASFMAPEQGLAVDE